MPRRRRRAAARHDAGVRAVAGGPHRRGRRPTADGRPGGAQPRRATRAGASREGAVDEGDAATGEAARCAGGWAGATAAPALARARRGVGLAAGG